MSFFGSSATQPIFGGSSSSLFGNSPSMSSLPSTSGLLQHNPMKDTEVVSPPDDSISSLAFSPGTLQQNYLIAGSWDNQVRCWEITGNAGTTMGQIGGSNLQSVPKAQQTHQGPILDVAWSDVS